MSVKFLRLYIALYRKFGKEYSDAFFRDFWGIEEQEK